jgi:N6-L-threonylcarbamoyladenine synthase
LSLVLGLETSCDETAAAVVRDGRHVLSNVVASQVALHRRYGGVVPELASRRHLEAFLPVVDQALREADVAPRGLDAVAVTAGPGLVGALVVGLAGASSLALAWGTRLMAVNHLEAHAYAVFLEPGPDRGGPDGRGLRPPEPPMVVLIVSGGHTSLAELSGHVRFRPLGETRDDAAGEVFDKVARHLGLGYPGGPVIDRLADAGDPGAVALPRAYLQPGSLDFSFSGLKTAVIYHVRQAEAAGRTVNLPDLAASFQAAVVDVLVEKSFRALEVTGHHRLAVVGGVAANRGLRRALEARAEREGVELLVPPPELCTDNAAMVAGLGHFLLAAGWAGTEPVRVNPSLGLGGRERRRGRRGR